MKINKLALSEDSQKKLEYIQQQTHQELETLISRAIDLYFQQVQKNKDPLARLKQSPLIGSFQGESDLSEKAEEIFQNLINSER
jgi:hypothetical protein